MSPLFPFQIYVADSLYENSFLHHGAVFPKLLEAEEPLIQLKSIYNNLKNTTSWTGNPSAEGTGYLFLQKTFKNLLGCCSKVNSILKEKSWQRRKAINQQTIHCHVWYFLLQKFPKQDFSNLELSICMVTLTFKGNLINNWHDICHLNTLIKK